MTDALKNMALELKLERLEAQKHIAWVDRFGHYKQVLQRICSKKAILGRFFFHANKYLSVVLSSEEIHANISFPGVQSWSTPARNQHIFIPVNSTSWKPVLSRCSFQPVITEGAGMQCDPQHGESRDPDLGKCWSKSEGTMSLRANSLFSLSSESEIPKVQWTSLLSQEVSAWITWLHLQN